jgi:hypothetical protein
MILWLSTVELSRAEQESERIIGQLMSFKSTPEISQVCLEAYTVVSMVTVDSHSSLAWGSSSTEVEKVSESANRIAVPELN